MSLKTLLILTMATLWYLSVSEGVGPCQPSIDFNSLPAPNEAAPQIEYAPAIAGYYSIQRSFIDSVRSGTLPYGMSIKDAPCYIHYYILASLAPRLYYPAFFCNILAACTTSRQKYSLCSFLHVHVIDSGCFLI